MRLIARLAAGALGLVSAVTGAGHAMAVPPPVRFTDSVGDVGYYAYDTFADYDISAKGPSFTPAVPLSTPDVKWVDAKVTRGGDYLIEAKMDNVFVYERQYARAGDRRSLNVAAQAFRVRLGKLQVVVKVNYAASGFAVTATQYGDDWDLTPCEVPAQVTFSRIHDLVAVTIPASCEDAPDFPVDPNARVSVFSQVRLDQVTTAGGRETSRSTRVLVDSAYGP